MILSQNAFSKQFPGVTSIKRKSMELIHVNVREKYLYY